MKTNLTSVAVSLFSSGAPRRPRRLRALALGALAVLAPLLAVAPALAGTPPGALERESDPVDLFLDRSRGDRASDESRAGTFELGVTASLGLSSWAAPSFGVLAFVTVPFDRLYVGRRRELTELLFAGGPMKLPPPDAGAPLSDRTRTGRASSTPSGRAAPASSAGATSGRAGATSTATSSSGATTSSGRATAASSASSGAVPRAAAADRAPGTPLDRAGLSPVHPTSAALAASSEEADPEVDADAAPAADPSPPPAAPALTSDLARGAARAACKAARLDEADARLDALASRAKTSALLPELRLRATRAIDETESLTPTEYDPLHHTASGSATTWLEARATFRLDRLVFADDEIAVERQRMARAAERSRLVERVLDLLDAWQRARAAAANPDAEPEAQARAALSVAASEASLDVLTDGWFSSAIVPSGSGARDTDVAVTTPAAPSARAAERDAGGAPPGATTSPARAGSAAFSSPSRAPSGASPDARVAPTAAPVDAAHPSASRALTPPARAEKRSK
jgi:hypothetical protein